MELPFYSQGAVVMRPHRTRLAADRKALETRFLWSAMNPFAVKHDCEIKMSETSR